MDQDPSPTDLLSWATLIRRLRSYAIFTMGMNRVIESWNAGIFDLLGYDEAEFVGQRADIIFTEEDRANDAPHQEMASALHSGEARDDRWHVRKDGRWVYVNGVMTPIRDEGGDVIGFMKVLRDETERYVAERDLERRMRERSAIAELGSYAFQVEDLDPLFRRATRLVADALEARQVNVFELDPRQDRLVLRCGTGDADGQEAASALVAEPSSADRPLTARRTTARHQGDGDEAWIDDDEALRELGVRSGISARIRGRGRPFGVIEVLADEPDAFTEDDTQFLRSVAHILARVVERSRLHEELAHRAEHDDLTGLPNRKVFENRLQAAIQQASRSGEKVAVLFLDLDRFKNVNDSLGHHAGDEILKSVACRLREAVRAWDTVARLGGDEFVLLLPNVPNEAEVAHVCERLLEAFEQPFAVADREIMVNTTIGASVYPNDADDVAGLLRAADTAMYDGKQSHRSTFHFFTAAQNIVATERLRLENDLRQAREQGEFELDFQPQVDLQSGRVAAAEALLRWRHPERGRLKPGAFLSTAEGIGLVVPIGEWMMSEAFRQYRTWFEEAGSPLRIAINIATPHFMQPTFPSTLQTIARHAGVDPRHIDVEITERAVLQDPKLVARHVEALKGMGASVTLDDFGTGYSSLMYLRTLPIDRLKVDESFTQALDEPEGTARAFVEAIVLLAEKLGVTVIMEGVETEDQVRVIRELGCHCAQGHFISRPLAPDDMLDFLRERGG